MRIQQFLLGTVALWLADVAAASDIGQIAQTLSAGGGVLQKLMWAACIIVGIMLISAAFTQFQIHRRNPKLVPLTTPVMYLILGIVAIAIPFTNTISGFMGAKVNRLSVSSKKASSQQQQAAQPESLDIDAPIQ